jgi:membrane-bound ClpP family serine protease
MTASIVILLLIIAIGLVLIEIFLIPGIGIAGIAGALLMITSLVLAYEVGVTFGHYVLASTGIISVGLVILAFRTKTWDRLSLKSDIHSKVDNPAVMLTVGDKGKTVGRLNPTGKALFNDKYIEVSSKGAYIEPETEIEIVQIDANKITVIQINK